MHTYMLFKVNADDADDAVDYTESLVEPCCGDNQSCDYFSATIVDESDLCDHDVDSYEELENMFRKMHDESYASAAYAAKSALRRSILVHAMTREDAPKYINYEGMVGSTAKGLLDGSLERSGADYTTLEGVVDMTSSAIISAITGKGSIDESAVRYEVGMHLLYALRELSELVEAIRNPKDLYAVLKSLNSHFYDATVEENKDSPVWYVLVNRHY